MLKLYEIPVAYRVLMDSIDETGELTPEIEAKLAELEGNIEDKVDSICALVREATADAEAYDAEAKRLQDRKRAAANRAESLKRYLQQNMEVLNIPKVKTPRFTASLGTASRPSIRWTGPVEAIPESLRKVEIKFDGTAAYEAYKAGMLDDARIEVSTSRFVTIR